MIKPLLLIFITISTLFAQKQYTIDELILEALAHSPDINISKLDLEASKRRYDQAFGSYLPKIDLSADATYIQAQDTPFVNDASDTLLTGKLSINQFIYDFGRTSGNVGSNKEYVKSFDATLKEQIIRKKRDVKIAYYDVLKNYALIEVNKESIKLNRAQLERSKRYYEAGIRTKIDISDAEVRVVKAEIALKNSEFDLENSYAFLDRIVGFTAPLTEYRLKEQEVDLSKKLYSSLPRYDLSLAEAITYAYENRPELAKYRYITRADKELEKTARSTYYPTVIANGTYINTQADKYQILNNEQFSAGIYLTWNIFKGGSDKAKQEEQRIQTQKSISSYEQAKLLIKENVTKAYIALNKTKEQVRLSENLLRLSKEKFDQISKQYEHGLSDYIELQEARQGYIDAKSNLVISYYSYFTALAILDATLGR